MTTITTNELINEPSVTTPDGSRYAFKANGSQFGSAGVYMRSCLACGNHRPANSGVYRKICGKSQFICSEDCCKKLGLKPLPPVAAPKPAETVEAGASV